MTAPYLLTGPMLIATLGVHRSEHICNIIRHIIASDAHQFGTGLSEANRQDAQLADKRTATSD